MPKITQITEQKRRANRRSVYLDGKFAFGCNINVIARFMLREGQELSTDQVEQIKNGEVKQECFDRTIKFLERRLHSRSELKQKLGKNDYPPEMIEQVLDRLEEMGYVNDKKFAETRAELSAKYKHHGPNRARIELAKKGVKGEVARQAVEHVYESNDNSAIARDLAQRKVKSLSKLEPHVAKRRLYGMLLRRGFDFDTIKPVVEEVLGAKDDTPEEST